MCFAERCVDGIRANRAGTDASAGATLAVATALNGAIGYDKGTLIVKRATESGRPLREVALEEGVDAKLYDETIDLRRIARGQPGRLRQAGCASARLHGIRLGALRPAGVRPWPLPAPTSPPAAPARPPSTAAR